MNKIIHNIKIRKIGILFLGMGLMTPSIVGADIFDIDTSRIQLDTIDDLYEEIIEQKDEIIQSVRSRATTGNNSGGSVQTGDASASVEITTRSISGSSEPSYIDVSVSGASTSTEFTDTNENSQTQIIIETSAGDNSTASAEVRQIINGNTSDSEELIEESEQSESAAPVKIDNQIPKTKGLVGHFMASLQKVTTLIRKHVFFFITI